MLSGSGGDHDGVVHQPHLYHHNSFHHRSSSYSLGEGSGSGSVSGYESEENLVKWRLMCNQSLAKVRPCDLVACTRCGTHAVTPSLTGLR